MFLLEPNIAYVLFGSNQLKLIDSNEKIFAFIFNRS